MVLDLWTQAKYQNVNIISSLPRIQPDVELLTMTLQTDITNTHVRCTRGANRYENKGLWLWDSGLARSHQLALQQHPAGSQPLCQTCHGEVRR